MKNQSFTLIEFVIYMGILAMILVLMTGFLWNIILGSIKERTFQEVQQNLRFSLIKITQEAKKATGINIPTSGSTSNNLSLAMEDVSLNPTIFDVANGKLRITKGQSGPYELTSDQVIISNLKFTNLSYPDTSGTIRVEMTIEHINPANRREYEASINSNLTISLLPGGAW